MLNSVCCIRGAPFQKVGLHRNTAQGEHCRLNMPCCDCAIIPPRRLCARASQILCVYNTAALPCDDEYLSEPVCAYYFISCWPRPGCCVPPPRSRALEQLWNVEEIPAAVAPGQGIMDRNSFDLLRRNNSDDGMEVSFERKRKNSDDGMDIVDMQIV